MKVFLALSIALLTVGCVATADVPKPPSLAEELTQLDAKFARDTGNFDRIRWRVFFRKHRTPPRRQSLRPLWYAHTTRYLEQISPLYNFRIVRKGKAIPQRVKREIGNGLLGYPFESSITVEGIRFDKGKGTMTLAVDKANGKDVSPPIPIWVNNIHNPGLPKGKRCIFKGIETGQWIGGIPYQAIWQFQHEFHITKVIIPEDLKLRTESQQLREIVK
jgi:hypothetical protein